MDISEVVNVDISRFTEQDARVDAEFKASEILTGFNGAAALLVEAGRLSLNAANDLHILAARITRQRKNNEISDTRNS